MANFSGAMVDILCLQSCLIAHEPALWSHFGGLGFHLSIVFCGAFMRLFAFLLPATSLYRFWDFLFSESTRCHRKDAKPPRHGLIDLAFGVLVINRAQLLQCESVAEIRDCIVDFLESLYDPSHVIDIVVTQEQFLWENLIHGTLGMEPPHVLEYRKAKDAYDPYLKQFQVQNVVMKDLTQHVSVNVETSDRRFTTRNFVNKVRPIINNIFQVDSLRDKHCGTVFRKCSPKVIDLIPPEDTSILGTVVSWIGNAADAAVHDHWMPPGAFSIPPPPPGDCCEPSVLESHRWQNEILNAFGPGWSENDIAKRIYDVFESHRERRMSINEFIVTAILCSKGTVSEKALALFTVYEGTGEAPRMHHIVPTPLYTDGILEKAQDAQDPGALLFYPPEDDAIPDQTVLHFKVYTKGMTDRDLLGEVFISSLEPFIGGEGGDIIVQGYNIWGPKMVLPPGMDLAKMGRVQGDRGRPVVGDLLLGIKWIPGRERVEVGQLILRVQSNCV